MKVIATACSLQPYPSSALMTVCLQICTSPQCTPIFHIQIQAYHVKYSQQSYFKRRFTLHLWSHFDLYVKSPLGSCTNVTEKKQFITLLVWKWLRPQTVLPDLVASNFVKTDTMISSLSMLIAIKYNQGSS